jgi:cytochrome c-type biogenesis protein
LDFKWRSAAAFQSRSGAKNGGGSLFDENGGLVLNSNPQETSGVNGSAEDDENSDELAALVRICLLGGTSALVASPCATPVLASLLAYLASASSSDAAASSSGDLLKGATWMLAYTMGYSTPLLAVGATGGQALVNLQKIRDDNVEGINIGALIGQWVTPLTGGVLIAFGMNGFLIALLGDPSLSGLAPIIE